VTLALRLKAEDAAREQRKLIVVERDFSRFPGGRFERHGPFSGERFRKELLVPALQWARSENGLVVVLLDGVAGYAGSFLEEAFGGLIRVEGFTHAELGDLLEIRAETPMFETFKRLAVSYIAEARPQHR
jgi:hypothetical protein